MNQHDLYRATDRIMRLESKLEEEKLKREVWFWVAAAGWATSFAVTFWAVLT